MEAIEILEENAWTEQDSYFGHNPEGYVAAAINRDSSILEMSNWHAMRKIIEKHSEILTDWNHDEPNAPYDFRASHWAVGWVEYLIIPESASDEIKTAVGEALSALSDYPILSEDDYSQRQYDAIGEYWENMSMSERIEYCKDNEVSIFQARKDYIESDRVYDAISESFH